MSYWVWVPATILMYVTQAFLSHKANIAGGKWHWVLFSISALTIWPFVARHSKHLVFDAILFDSILVVTYTSALLYFTGMRVNGPQAMALFMVGSGLILFKIFS